MLDITKIPLDDEKVWDLICSGKVKGCFQIESHLGRTWCKKAKPRNISELSDLISIVRPGTLKFVYDGKSMAQHYVDRKSGLDEPIPLHPSLTDILKDTYQVIIYQEQIIQISREIAGYSESEGDVLRKSIGKKNAALLASLEEPFVNGCVKVGKVNKEQAQLIFSNIKKSARYLFNKSHGVSYAYLAYWSAYLKTHYPSKFYLNWLKQADDKIDPDKEMKELIMSARSDGINVFGPSLDYIEDNFTEHNKNIYFGFCNVKNVGLNEFIKLKERLSTAKLDKWLPLMVNHLLLLNKRTVENLIYVGTFSRYGKSRLEMVHEITCLRELTDKELDWLSMNLNENISLSDNLRRLSIPKKDGGGVANKNRTTAVLELINRIENPGRDLSDNPSQLSKIERQLLGCEISMSELDGCADAAYANCTCVDYNNKNHEKYVVIAATIKSYREIETKNNEKMCFLTIEDKTGEMENVIVFPNIYDEFGGIIYEDSNVLITGSRSQKGDSSFIVERLEQI